ncbi:ketopantoate reductase family protein [Halomicrobium salinisoli]|uniref:ketopantoate reductase family protein n=1 Tax=Halomicrobium salinisoli TaxID=2878391 RepID=UPI001CF0BE80|nr:2-dehydropantoate 2-reductase [Halomicrobium salinisoli]
MDVLVFGAGSLGSLLGGLLARDHDVTLVGRDPHAAAIREDGLRITGAVETHLRPEAVTAAADAGDGSGWDLAVVAVKAHDTPQAAAALADCDLGACLSVQNGLGNEERLAAALDCPVLAGTCTYGARLDEPGSVECTGVGEVVLGPREGGESPAAERVGAAFDEAGVETTVATDMPRRLWEKLAVNAGINATTALSDLPNGALLDGPANDLARAAARETARVARTDGVDLPDDEAVAAVERVAEATAENVSSMRRDLQRGRRTEIDAINGAVVERADEPVPVNEALTRLVRAWEQERELR